MSRAPTIRELIEVLQKLSDSTKDKEIFYVEISACSEEEIKAGPRVHVETAMVSITWG